MGPCSERPKTICDVSGSRVVKLELLPLPGGLGIDYSLHLIAKAKLLVIVPSSREDDPGSPAWNNRVISERLWLCLPPVVLCGIDGGLTLWGQPSEYWTNGYHTFREGNPLAAWLLTVHPLAFGVAGLAYCLSLCGVLLWLPLRFSRVLAGLVSLAHAVAVVAWTITLLGDSGNPWVLLVPAMTAGAAALWWRAGRSLA
jgi:hypothetical protein